MFNRGTKKQVLTVDISEDADLTNAIETHHYALFGLVVPANFDGTEIKFHVSADDSTYVPLRDADDAVIARTVTASMGYDLPTELAAWPYFKIETTTDQATTDTVFTVVCKA
jgi:hypothetical protein